VSSCDELSKEYQLKEKGKSGIGDGAKIAATQFKASCEEKRHERQCTSIFFKRLGTGFLSHHLSEEKKLVVLSSSIITQTYS